MQRPLIVPGVSCSSGQGFQVFNPGAFTLVGYQIGTIMPNMEPRGYCTGPSLLNTDLSVDKNFKVTERVRLQFRLDLFDLFNHPNFRGDQINRVGGGSTFANVNCGPVLPTGLYNSCSPTNNVISTQTLATGFGQATSVVGNAGRELRYGVHITF